MLFIRLSTIWRAIRLFVIVGLIAAAWRFLPQALPPRLHLSPSPSSTDRADAAGGLASGLAPVASHGESGSLGLDAADPAAVPALAIGGRGDTDTAMAAAVRSDVEPVSRAGTHQVAYTWPLHGEVTSYFGPRDDEFHTGIDIAAVTGDPVRAARAGTVVEAGWRGGYGLAVVIDHGDNVQTLYGHNSHLEVEVGDTVDAGDLIALAGSTGHSTGPHVHFEILIRGFPVNPLPWLER